MDRRSSSSAVKRESSARAWLTRALSARWTSASLIAFSRRSMGRWHEERRHEDVEELARAAYMSQTRVGPP